MSQKTYEELVTENQKLHAENTELKIKVENQQLHINALNRCIFGSKRESTPKEENVVEGTQCSLFGEVQDEEIKEQVKEKTEKTTSWNKKIRIKKRRKRNDHL